MLRLRCILLADRHLSLISLFIYIWLVASKVLFFMKIWLWSLLIRIGVERLHEEIALLWYRFEGFAKTLCAIKETWLGLLPFLAF